MQAADDIHILPMCQEVHAIDRDIASLCKAHPDVDADMMPGYPDLEARRSAWLYLIQQTPALTLAGIAAKAKVLLTPDVDADCDIAMDLGQSIAKDIIQLHGGAHG